ncbi:MAG: glycine cleavage system protein GcvH [Fimbriimonadaceae bacterium]|nr:glycine cleavage system protein GcvH [Fimbriimonadaceae bacterium]
MLLEPGHRLRFFRARFGTAELLGAGRRHPDVLRCVIQTHATSVRGEERDPPPERNAGEGGPGDTEHTTLPARFDQVGGSADRVGSGHSLGSGRSDGADFRTHADCATATTRIGRRFALGTRAATRRYHVPTPFRFKAVNNPPDLKYTKSHEWVRLEGDVATIGITDHAQSELGDIVFIDMPEVGRALQAEESFGTVESVKTVSDLYAPIAGEVIAVNEALGARSELVNTAPFGEGWLVKVRVSNPADVDALLDADAYTVIAEA